MHKTDTPQGLTPSTSTIALTGATGFIGKKIRNQLIAAGFKVKCLTRTKSTNSRNSWEEHLTDLKSTDSISTAIKGTHAIIYIAGTVRGASPSDFKAANVEGVRNITSVLAKTQPTTPILLISSLAADFPHLSNYAKSKAEGEQALIKSSHSKWSIFRPPAVYGDGDHELRNVFKLMRLGIVTAIAPLEQKLPFIEVTDLANAAVSWALNTERCEQKIYAIDDGEKGGYNWREMAKLVSQRRALFLKIPVSFLNIISKANLLVARIFRYKPMLTPGKVRELSCLKWSCDNSQFTLDTKWQPKVGLAQGVAKLFELQPENNT